MQKRHLGQMGERRSNMMARRETVQRMLRSSFDVRERRILFKDKAFEVAFSRASTFGDFEEITKQGWIRLFEAEFLARK
jgi:hypothetical protein